MTRRLAPLAVLAALLAGPAAGEDVVRLGNLKFAHYGAVSYMKELGPKYGLRIEERVFPKGLDILPAIVAAVASGGCLIYETFAIGNERFGKPSNPDFLLRPGELLETVRGRLTVLAYEDLEVSEPRPAMIQRIAARVRSFVASGLMRGFKARSLHQVTPRRPARSN